MRILLYTKEAAQSASRQRELLESNFRGTRVETFSTIEDLTRRLRELSEEAKTVILLIQDHEEFKSILSIQHLFLNVPLMIQVPDASAETLQMAHRLRPRYLNSAQGDFGMLMEVLRKMLNNREQNREMNR